MGEAKRRKQILKEKYDTAETSSRKILQHVQANLLPDYGAHYLATFGAVPLNVRIESAFVSIGSTEGNICWNAHGYAATLIVSPEFAEAYVKNPSEFLQIVPDPEDAYNTPLRERVVPFKLASM